jgi:hypothetical protein
MAAAASAAAAAAAGASAAAAASAAVAAAAAAAEAAATAAEEAALAAAQGQIEVAAREAAIKAAKDAADSLERNIRALSAEASVREMLRTMISGDPMQSASRLRLEKINPDDERVQVIARTADGKSKSFTVYGSTPEEVIDTLRRMLEKH